MTFSYSKSSSIVVITWRGQRLWWKYWLILQFLFRVASLAQLPPQAWTSEREFRNRRFAKTEKMFSRHFPIHHELWIKSETADSSRGRGPTPGTPAEPESTSPTLEWVREVDLVFCWGPPSPQHATAHWWHECRSSFWEKKVKDHKSPDAGWVSANRHSEATLVLTTPGPHSSRLQRIYRMRHVGYAAYATGNSILGMYCRVR